MGANQSLLLSGSPPAATTKPATSSTTTSKSDSLQLTSPISATSQYSATARENDYWLTANVAKLLDDNYVNEWHKKNDLFVWLEKERHKKSSSSSSSSASASSASSSSS